ncbi:MAG: carbohydrate ABC transporter permease [Turicibacter sp.]
MSSFHGTKINPDRHHKSQIKFYLILIPMAIFMGLPIVYIFSHAFKPLDELFAYPPRFFVTNPTLDNFKTLFSSMASADVPVSRYLFNSILSSLVVVVLTILISTGAGYALSKKNFKLKKTIFNINTLSLMFVPIAVAIPRYLIIVQSGIIDSFWAHIIPFLAMPMGIFLVKQFVDQIPNELIEAAQMDGAKDIRIFFQIIMPLIKPVLATIAILSFQSVWNSTEASGMFINDENLKTFSFYMSTLTSANNSVAGQGIAAVASLIMFVPNLIVFIVMQKNVMSTMAHSGIK